MAEQDRILGYFLDEAQEHLRVIEEGLTEPSLLSQPAQIKEIFRAAHSLKGGAAMLDLETVQQIGHHFEQAFKQIKDHSLTVDESLQNLLLEGFEILRLAIQLLKHQQTPPMSLAEEAVFEKVRLYMSLHGGEMQAVPNISGFLPDPAIEQVFGNYVNQKLLQFTEICHKSPDNTSVRQQLAAICQKIGVLGDRFEFLAWTNLLISCRLAVENPTSTIFQMSDAIPNAVKQAQVLVIAGRHHAITLTPELEKLLTPLAATPGRAVTAFTGSLAATEDSLWSDEQDLNFLIPEMHSSLPNLDLDASDSIDDFLFAPQPITAAASAAIGGENPANIADMKNMDDMEDFMQLFDEELPVDGTWVQDEDIFAEEFAMLNGQSAPNNDPDSAALWDQDIFARPLPVLAVDQPEIDIASQLAATVNMPQFNFEQPDDAELFMADAVAMVDHQLAAGEVDWSELLADIPDEVVVDYQEPVVLSSASAINLSPTEASDDFDDFLNAPAPTEASDDFDDFLNAPAPPEASNDFDEFSNDPFALIDLGDNELSNDSLTSDLDLATSFDAEPPPPDDPPDLPVQPEPAAADANIPTADRQLIFLDSAELQELSTFDDLLADTKITDVNLADLDQIILNGNLESEIELEDLEDFSLASVSPNQIDAPDNLLTEAKPPLNNLYDLTERPMPPGDIAIENIQLPTELDLLELDMNLEELGLDVLDLSPTGDMAGGDCADLLADLELDSIERAAIESLEMPKLAAVEGEIGSLNDAESLSLDELAFDAFGNLDELDSLLQNPSDVAAPENLADLDLLLAVETPVDSQKDRDEFDQIEKMLPRSDSPQIERKVAANPGARAKKQRTFEQSMRVSVKSLDNLNNLAGELVVNRNTLEQDQNRMRQFVDKLLLEVHKLNEVGKSMQDLYEKSLLESSLLANRQHQQAPSAPSEYDEEGTMAEIEYDPLEMDRFTPIHLISQQMIELTVRIRESTSDIEFVVDNSTEVTRSLRQINSQIQEDLNKSRMLPFAQTADRLQRGVRDNGLKYGKQVELHVEGRDTMIDKVILESLNDPLVHMVNNAIAHGIESPAARVAAGKSAVGSITISATHRGTQTIISVADDGAGIDIEKVKSKALEKGIITPVQALGMTKAELYELLFLPSFSTKDRADELAGRGVGMDVVRTSLQEIRGTITTESKLGEGTTFTIRLPLALSIVKALMAVNKDAGIAFPMDGIEDSQDIKPEDVVTNEAGQKCFQWRNQLMPFRPLSDLLSFNRPMRRISYYNHLEEEEERVSIVVLRSGGHLIAVEVDRVMGEQEIVIKPLQGPAPKPVGIAGATVLGDGRIIPIADVMELIDLANGIIRKQSSGLWSLNAVVEELPAQREPMVLVVDDSITVRQLLSLTFTRAGYRVEQARDGQEAWDKLRAGLPCDIIFCDIEMPRMDGLELLAKVQQDEALKKVPMAMLTSRGSDRHRQIASNLGACGYFIKPYLEDALLEAVKRMIKGEMLAIV